MLGEVQLGRILDQQDKRLGFDLLARLLPMWLHQGLKGDIGNSRATDTRRACLSRSAPEQATRRRGSGPCERLFSLLVLCGAGL